VVAEEVASLTYDDILETSVAFGGAPDNPADRRRSSRRGRVSLSLWRSRESVGEGMQNVDRVAHVEALPQPGRACRARVQAESLRVVLRPQGLHWIGRHRGRGRDLR
jgi:hypothetical protein